MAWKSRGFNSLRVHPTSLKLRGAQPQEDLRTGPYRSSKSEGGNSLFILMFYVYILKLSNNQHYIGFTKDLKTRFKRHFQNAVPTTKRIKPEKLIYYSAFISKKKALAFEKYLKSSSGFAFRNKRLI